MWARERLAVMSIGFLLQNPDDPVIWRGPKKTAMIKQFIDDVTWGNLDYLVIDTPPGEPCELFGMIRKDFQFRDRILGFSSSSILSN